MNASPVCRMCGEPGATNARFCSACGANLTWPAAERRIITVLFADISGFTRLTERLDAERVHSLITTWLDPLCDAVVRWGGHVDKFIGDCVMALFGAPVAYENEPERAVRAALDMHAAFDEAAIIEQAVAAGLGDYRPRLSIGVNTGGVVTGMFSSGGAWDYTAIGDTVNVAARLQGQCEPGGILVGHATYEQTRHLFEYGEEALLQVKGRNELVRARMVTGVRAERGEARGFRDRLTPLVGRDEELGRLVSAWEEARQARAQVRLILGPAGIGKSRIVHELVTRADADDPRVARGRSYPYASSTPWEPVAELVRDLHGIAPGDSGSEAVDCIVSAPGEQWDEELVDALGGVLGVDSSDGSSPLEDLAPDERHAIMGAAVLQALRQGSSRPAILVLEDLHWADRATLDFVATLAHESRGVGGLLLLVARPPLPAEEHLAEFIEVFAPHTIRLLRLPASHTAEMVEAILGPNELADDVVERVHASSGGNPLFVEEILKSLIDSERIARREGRWVPAGTDVAFDIPDSIESVITTRLDGLDPATKSVLQQASVVGRRFSAAVIEEALVGRSVRPELDRLVAASLVQPHPSEEEYDFEHLLLQEITYDGLLSDVRRDLHGTVAAWLEERVARGTTDHDDLVAYHFERSGEPGRALPYLQRSIESAFAHGAVRDAAAIAERGLAIATSATDRARLLGAIEEAAAAIGDDARRVDALERFARLADEAADARLAAGARYLKGRRHLDLGELDQARDEAARALEGYRALEDPSAEADAVAVLGRVAHLRGSYEEALSRYTDALELERGAGDRRGEADVLVDLGLVQVDFGNYPGGLKHFDEAVRIYDEISHRPGQARALANRASALRWLGLLESAEAAAQLAIATAESSGSRGAVVIAHLSRAAVRAEAGDLETAVEALRALTRTVEDLRRPDLEAHVWLTLALYERDEAAAAAVERARSVGARIGLVHTEVFGLTRLADLALDGGDIERAEELSGAAVAVLERYGDAPGPDEVVYHVRARALEAAGRAQEADTAREKAREIVETSAAHIEDAEWRAAFLASGRIAGIAPAGGVR